MVAPGNRLCETLNLEVYLIKLSFNRVFVIIMECTKSEPLCLDNLVNSVN